MYETTVDTTEYQAITTVIHRYIEGAALGSGEVMKPSFHKDSAIFGYAGADLFAGPIQQLFDWCDDNGPSPELTSHIANIDVTGTAATVRVELDNLAGGRFTDMFTLLKLEGEWKIMNKVFHLHG